MKAQNEPFFMSNEDWYVYDEEAGCYLLTEKAPEKAKRSYIDFYKNHVYNGEDILKSIGIEK